MLVKIRQECYSSDGLIAVQCQRGLSCFAMGTRQTREQISSGGVLYSNTSDQIRVVLIRRTTPDGQSSWCLPKGWVEKGETLETTALREVKEETGLEGTIVADLGKITYQFKDRHEKAKIHKTVYFFLIEFLKGDTSQHDDEVDEARWFDPKEAERKLSYQNERKIFRKALKLISA